MLLGLELQDGMIERARKNVQLNDLQGRVEIVPAPYAPSYAPRSPQFLTESLRTHRIVQRPAAGLALARKNAVARHETEGDLRDFLRAAAYLLRGKGRITIVYPALRSIDVLAVMRELGIEPKRVRLVHSFVGTSHADSGRGHKRRSQWRYHVLPPLIVYSRAKDYTDEVASIIAGSRDDNQESIVCADDRNRHATVYDLTFRRE